MTSSTTKINRRVASEFLGPRAYKMSVKDIKLAASRLPCKFRRKFIPDPPLRPKPPAPEPLSTEPSPVPHNVPPRFRRKPWLAPPAPAQCALIIRVPSMEHRIASLSSEVALLRQQSQLPDGAEKETATRRKPAHSRAARSSASKTGKENTLGDRRQATIEQGVITRSRAATIASARRTRGAGSRRR